MDAVAADGMLRRRMVINRLGLHMIGRANEKCQVRVSLIGCGRWGSNIARSLSRIGALDAIYDPWHGSLEAMAAELGASVARSFDEALQHADGVAIAAPAVRHAELVRRSLAAGKNVFVEKPLALDLEEAEALAAEAERRGLVLMIGHLLRYHRAFQTMAQMVDEGAIGELRHIHSNRLNPGQIRTEENALWSMGPHDFSMILRLAGAEPTLVETLAVRVVDPKIPDQFHIQMRFSPTLSASAAVSWVAPVKEHKLTALGTTGALQFEDTAAPERKLVHFPGYIDDEGDTPRFVKQEGNPVPVPQAEPLLDEMQWFVDSVVGKKQPLTGPNEAIPVLRLLQSASEAAGL